MYGADWDVRVSDDGVVVELPRKLTLDEREGARLYATLREAVSGSDAERVLLRVDIEHPLSATLHDVVRRAARVAADNGLTDWHVTSRYDTKATAVAGALTGVETAVPDDREQPTRVA